MRRLAVFVALASAGCGSRPQAVAPQSPNQTLAQFMDAVKANDLKRMGALWGDENGSVATRKKPEELNQRLTVMRIYLVHDGYRVIEGPLPVAGQENLFTYHVELQRQGCNIAAPIDLVHAHNGGWFVHDVHMESLPNPARGCQGRASGTPP